MKASRAHPKNGAGRRRDAARTRDALIAAGTGLFAERGYDGVPVATIAAKAKVNKAMINYHFGGKRNLYVAIVSATFSEIVSRVEALADSSRPAPDLLRDLVADRRGHGDAALAALLHDDAARGPVRGQAPRARGAGQAGAGARRRAAHRGARRPRGDASPGRSGADPSQHRRQPGVLLRDGRLPGARALEPTAARAQAAHARGLRQSPPGDDHARARHQRGGGRAERHAESEAPGARAPTLPRTRRA